MRNELEGKRAAAKGKIEVYTATIAQWVEDRRWAANVRRAREFQRDLLFSERKVFHDALRHPSDASPSMVFAYPDTFYMVTIDDLCRAIGAVTDYRVRRLYDNG